MSTIGITTNILLQIDGVPSAANEFVTDLNRLAQHLQSGNFAAAQQDLAVFSENVLHGDESSTATTSKSGNTTSLLTDIASSPETSASSTTVTQPSQSIDTGDSGNSVSTLSLLA